VLVRENENQKLTELATAEFYHVVYDEVFALDVVPIIKFYRTQSAGEDLSGITPFEFEGPLKGQSRCRCKIFSRSARGNNNNRVTEKAVFL